MALPVKVPEDVKNLIRVRIPEPNKAVEENPVVKFLQELLDAYHEANP